MGTNLAASLSAGLSTGLDADLAPGETFAPVPVTDGLITSYLPEDMTLSALGTISAAVSPIDEGDNLTQAAEISRPTAMRDPSFGNSQPVTTGAINEASLENATVSTVLSDAVSGTGATGNPWTMYWLGLVWDASSSLRKFFELSDNTDSNRVTLRYFDTGTGINLRCERRVGGLPNRITAVTETPYDTHFKAAIRYGTANEYDLWLNGSEDVSQTSTRVLTDTMVQGSMLRGEDDVSIGATMPVLLIYNRALTDEELGELDAWADARWPNLIPADYLTRDPIAVAGQSNGVDFGDWGAATFTNVAVNGAGMSRWKKTAADLYPSLQTWIAARGSEDVWVYWVQGETDAAGSTTADAYAAELALFISDLRADCPTQTIKFTVQPLNPTIDDTAYPYWATVRAATIAVAAADPDVHAVDVDDVDLNGANRDGIHYRTDIAHSIRRRHDYVRSQN